MSEVWKCCGCGVEVHDLVKTCNCATMVAAVPGTGKGEWMTLPGAKKATKEETAAAAYERGLRDENEACAKVADEHGWHMKDSRPTDYEQGARDVADKIASRIRARIKEGAGDE